MLGKCHAHGVRDRLGPKGSARVVNDVDGTATGRFHTSGAGRLVATQSADCLPRRAAVGKLGSGVQSPSNENGPRGGPIANELLSASAASLQTASLFARLLVVRVLFQLAEKAALLQLHIEALESAIDGLIRLYGHVDQKFVGLRRGDYGTAGAPRATGFEVIDDLRLTIDGGLRMSIVNSQSSINLYGAPARRRRSHPARSTRRWVRWIRSSPR